MTGLSKMEQLLAFYDWERKHRPDEAAPKDHEVRELVNALRDVAVQHHASPQLRERIAGLIRPWAAATQSATPASAPVGDGATQPAPGGDALHALRQRIAELEAALDYHSAAYHGRLPGWIPVRVHLPAEVFGDPPFRGRGVAAGEHACQCNKHGAVSVIDRGGKLLGLRPAEFRVLEWGPAAQAGGGK